VTAAILFFGCQAVIEGALTIGELVAFNIFAGRVSQPVLRLAQIWQDFHQARLSVARLGDILNTTPEPTFNSGRTGLRRFGAMSPSSTGISLPHRRPEVLHDINLQISAGQTVGIVGPSGSGKSTIAKIVQRLYVPESGRVLVDGVDVAVADPTWLRRQIGVVLQENVLFNTSVRENIALADRPCRSSASWPPQRLPGRTSSSSSCRKVRHRCPRTRQQPVGGQRQRVAIARALVTIHAS